MEQTLNIENKEIRLRFNDGANCWQTKTIIDNFEIELEIDIALHIDKEVDWTHFKDFYSFINKENRLTDLIKDSKQLVEELGRAFFRDCFENVADYKMEFSNSIYYNGKTDGTFVQNGFSYSLIYNYWTKRQDGIHGDEYGLYLVDIENHIIVGAKRRQC
ncbi:hypothetical protein [Flectobacillus roseus]|uniref:hypothetical protein n=1 Tax=Flectobacillus roseus TaxID=502259 RepID=UPI0024B6B4A8|nr:hypothetical protein [Flectobacillus roseus]MDI9868966.1 hypothetical protein [Flectobacillus roseus]